MSQGTLTEQNDGEKLTMKQLMWLKEYVKSGNATDAALKTYDCKDELSAAVIGSQNLRKLKVDSLLEEMGLTDKLLVTLLAKGLVEPTKKIVKRVRRYNKLRATPSNTLTGGIYARDDKGNRVILGVEEVVEYEHEDVPDHQARTKNLEIALKVKKRLVNETQTGNHVNLEGATIQIINYGQPKEVIVQPEGGEIQNGKEQKQTALVPEKASQPETSQQPEVQANGQTHVLNTEAVQVTSYTGGDG